jgi:hypothetical protein
VSVVRDTCVCARRIRLTAITTSPGVASPWAARSTSTMTAATKPTAYPSQPSASQPALRTAERTDPARTSSLSAACRAATVPVTP